MTIQTALQQGFERLRNAKLDAPKLTAEVLLCHLLGREHIFLITHPDEELTGFDWMAYTRMLQDRIQGKPTQYITCQQEFWGRNFTLSPAVLIPRPETEHVVEAVLELKRAGAPRVLDIGTGSGALAVTLALELGTRVVASDLSGAALAVARGNARRYRATCLFAQCDLGAAFAARSFDVVVSNPPYIASAEIETLQREVRDYEPRLALDGGADGLDVYRRLIPDAARLLAPGGWLVLEIGAAQGAAVPALFDAHWSSIEVRRDLAGCARVVRAQYAA